MPAPTELELRFAPVMHVLYLVYNERYAATSRPGLLRSELSSEAIRLTRLLRRALPDDGEVAGLLALMWLTVGRAGRPRPGAGPAGRSGPQSVERQPDRRGDGPPSSSGAVRAS
jgi:predicted RNA polymerase sigma factor